MARVITFCWVQREFGYYGTDDQNKSWSILQPLPITVFAIFPSNQKFCTIIELCGKCCGLSFPVCVDVGETIMACHCCYSSVTINTPQTAHTDDRVSSSRHDASEAQTLPVHIVIGLGGPSYGRKNPHTKNKFSIFLFYYFSLWTKCVQLLYTFITR